MSFALVSASKLTVMAVLAMPYYFRSELHERQVENKNQVVQEAAADVNLGVAILCGSLRQQDRGSMCEPVLGDDVEDARSRLILRMNPDRAYVDGDAFVPRDGRHPRVVDFGETTYGVLDSVFKVVGARDRNKMTHVHVCPVVEKATFGEFQMQDDKLCMDVRQDKPDVMDEVSESQARRNEAEIGAARSKTSLFDISWYLVLAAIFKLIVT